MSLINDMLRDLDNRRKHEQNGKTFTEVPVAVKSKRPSNKPWLFFGVLFLLLVCTVGIGAWFFPFNSNGSSESSVNVENKQQLQADSVQHSAQSETAQSKTLSHESSKTQVNQTTETIGPGNTDVVIKEKQAVTTLIGMEVNGSAKNTSLTLHFNENPEYSLEQDGRGNSTSKLIISLNGVQLGDTLEIPELKGKLLESISLRPLRKYLQIQVDLVAQSEVGSYKVKGNLESGYTLKIDINQAAPLLAAASETVQNNKETTIESKKRIVPESTKQDSEVSPHLEKTDDTAQFSRSKNRFSQEKKAYQSGLEQMRRGDFAAAESSFTAALKINPAYAQARLHLITSLQQQNKKELAQTQMREGLAQTPRNLQLRKIYARYLLSKQHNLEAIKVLQTQPFPTVAQDLEYHALLAALLQETRQFDAAAQTYARLLQLRPETALWWFGFAVSMDQAGDFDQARNAYRRALALPGLSTDVQKYVQNRLQVL